MTDTIVPFQNKKSEGRGKVSANSDYEDDFIEECREAGVDEASIRAGGDYRQGDKTIYWLPLPELLTFEIKDAETIDDDEFWEWFQAFIDEKGLQTKAQKTKKKSKTWDDWRQDFDWAPQKISNWWSNWGYSSSGSSGSELTRRLAVALKAINTTVSVVNDTGKRYRVSLASNDQRETPTSYTNYGEQQIVVSPQSLLDTNIDKDTGVEVATGWALHEASHVKYSESLVAALRTPTELRPAAVAHLFYNLLEDLRIEHLTGLKFPGFAEYFDTGNKYLWSVMGDKFPSTWGPELQDKVNSAIALSKWPVEYEPTAKADPDLALEWPWWREWAETYVAGKEPIRHGVIRALEHLAEDEETKEQMEQMTQAEKEHEQATGQNRTLTEEEFGELLKQLKEIMDKGGQVFDPCPSPGNPQSGQQSQQIELTAEQAAELETLITEEYQQFEAFYKMKEGEHGVAPMIEVSRPQEDEYSRQCYNRPGPLMERLRSVFFFRKKAANENERLLRNGFVDEEELWRAGAGDPRVFERTSIPEDAFTSVTMLVDASGSMMGSGLEKAQDLANVMMACLRTQRGVRTRVRAHSTGAVAGSQTCRVYRIWDPGDPDTRLGILSGALDHGSNFDGFAIDWCAKELFDTAQANEEKLLIVLSDGLPAGSISDATRGYIHYGGESAMMHMREVGENWGRKGVNIVQIAIDGDGIRPEQQAKMFKHWIGYESDGKLLNDLTQLLAKTFGAVE